MADMADRADRADRTDRADIADMADMADMADRADRADRADMADSRVILPTIDYIDGKSEIMNHPLTGPQHQLLEDAIASKKGKT